MTYIIDSGEKEYVFETFDLMGVDYIKKEISFFVCNSCGFVMPHEIESTAFVCCANQDLEVIRVGDITNTEYSFLIERKKGQDLASSLDGNHIYEQLEKIYGLFKENTAIVFEGNFEDLIIDPNNSTRVGQILSLPAACMQHGISFIQVGDLTMLIKMLKYFDHKCGKEPKYRVFYKRLHEKIPKFEKLLMGMKGCGEQIAKNIHAVYPNAVEFGLDLRAGHLKKIKKVGPKKASLFGEYFL